MNIGEADAGRDGRWAGDGPTVQVGPPSSRSHIFLDKVHLVDSGLVLHQLVKPHICQHLLGSWLVPREKIIYIMLCCWFWFDKIFSTSGWLVVLIGSSTSSSGSPPTQTRKRAYALIRRKNRHGQRLSLMLIWDIPKHAIFEILN